jgi:hypothetical protein
MMSKRYGFMSRCPLFDKYGRRHSALFVNRNELYGGANLGKAVEVLGSMKVTKVDGQTETFQ